MYYECMYVCKELMSCGFLQQSDGCVPAIFCCLRGVDIQRDITCVGVDLNFMRDLGQISES